MTEFRSADYARWRVSQWWVSVWLEAVNGPFVSSWSARPESWRCVDLDTPDLVALARWAVLHDDPTYLLDAISDAHGSPWGEAAVASAAARI